MLPSIYHYRWDWLPDPDLVQHVSLPLEIIGLFLALLEIYFPRHADRLEHAVDWLAESISELLPERPPKYSPEEEAELRSRSLTGSLPHAFDEWSNPALDPTMRQFGPGRYATKWEMFFESVALRMALACGMFAWYSLVGWFGVFIPFGLIILYHWLSATKSSAGEGGLFVTMILLGLPLIPIAAIGYILRAVLEFFDNLGKGKATGGLGLTLGGLGFLGEVYQVAMLNDDPVTRLEYWSIIVALLTALGIVVFFVHRIVTKEQGTAGPA